MNIWEREDQRGRSQMPRGAITRLSTTHSLSMNSVATFYLGYWTAERTPSTAASAFYGCRAVSLHPSASLDHSPHCVPLLCVPMQWLLTPTTWSWAKPHRLRDSLHKTAFTLGTSCEFEGPNATYTSDVLVINVGILTSPSGSIICNNNSQNSGKCYPSDYSFIITKRYKSEPIKGRDIRARSGRISNMTFPLSSP